MKKLLSLIGAMTLMASPIGAVVACGNKNAKEEEKPDKVEDNFETAERQDTISKLMSQYAKSLYLNQNELSDGETHFSSKYMMENNVKNEYLKTLNLTDFNESEGVEGNAKFYKVADKYFNTNDLLASDLKISDNVYQDYVLDPSAPDEGIVDIVKNTLPTILSLLSDPTTLQQLLGVVASNPSMIGSIISPDLLKTLGKVLNQDNLKLLENAFSNKIYANMSYQTALDSSMIGLSNAVNKLLNGSETKLSYETQADVEQNIDSATTNLADNISNLMSGTAELKIDFISNIDSIAEVIRFIRTLVVYMEQFSYEEMTSSVLTLEKIEEKRNQIFNSNSIDIKQLFKKINYMVNDDLSGVVFKNYIGILFATNSKNFSIGKQFTENVNDGLMGLLSKIGVKAMKEESINIIISKVYVNSMIRSIINGGLNSSYGGSLFSTVIGALVTMPGILPSPVKELMQKITSVSGEGKKFKSDWMGYLWNNTNENFNFSIRDLMSKPMNEISLSGLLGEEKTSQPEDEQNPTEPAKRFNEAKASSMNFLTNKSIKELVNEFNTEFSSTTKSTINFSDFGELMARFAKDSTLEKALNDIDNMFEILGYNSDGSLKEGSVFEQLFKILNDEDELIAKMSNILSKWIKESNQEVTDLKNQAEELFKKLTVKTEIKSVNNFRYTVNDGTNELVFDIAMKYKNKKLVVSEIKLIA
ncbi:MOLPALP family lipoprotein [Spiroplasma endosymbiont of Cantharis rufa]|uniref:MOLPALP family lipoprotein n=1 Tax=Spiroplasma endosymbiont of Cantharis rufa TaxID=3066279 RepID=UPI0030CD46E5